MTAEGKYVWVVQNLELGWDSVVAIIPVEDCEIEDLIKEFQGDTYVFQTKQINKLDHYRD